MRIELEDILDDATSACDAAHLSDLLIRFRFAEPRPPGPYFQYLLQNGRDPRTILPAAPNRDAVASTLEQLRTALRESFTSQRERPLMTRGGVTSPADLLRWLIDHACRPLWLYTNGQTLASLVERRGACEALVHASLDDYLSFSSPQGLLPSLEALPGARFSTLAAAESWIAQRLGRVRIERLPMVKGGETRSAFLQRAGDRAGAGGHVRTWLLHFAGGVRRIRLVGEVAYPFLNHIDLDGFRAGTCATCSRFSFSGMSRDGSGGTKGYCGLRAGDARAPEPEHALVSVFDSCGQHDFIEDAARPQPIGPLFPAWTPEDAAAAAPPMTAKQVAQIMAANMRENQRDPDFLKRQTLQRSLIAREIIERAGLGGGRPLHDRDAHAAPRPAAGDMLRLGPSRYADIFLSHHEGGLVVIKSARSPDAPAPPWPPAPLAECEALFTTGLIVFGDPEPGEIVRREAEALAVLAPATPRPDRTGVHESDGTAFVIREYVEGATWREILNARRRVPLYDLRGLVEVLAWIEESTVLGYHGDVKPDNIITSRTGVIRLIDPTSAFSCMAGGDPVKRMLTTPEYNPRLAPSDHAALALTIVEMITGHQLIADAAGYRTPRPISAALADSLRVAASTGSDLYARRLPLIDLPGELSSQLRGPAEALLLRALGLSWNGTMLDVGKPLGRIRDLKAALPK